jgi:hypothetical protein
MLPPLAPTSVSLPLPLAIALLPPRMVAPPLAWKSPPVSP